jgi:hypothetical protein
MQVFGILIALIVGLELFEKYDNASDNIDTTETVESSE